MKLPALESEIASDGLTHAHMLDFFRLFNTSASDTILPTFDYWVAQLREAGVTVEEDWYNRISNDLVMHGRISHETLIQAEPMKIIQIGDDQDVD